MCALMYGLHECLKFDLLPKGCGGNVWHGCWVRENGDGGRSTQGVKGLMGTHSWAIHLWHNALSNNTFWELGQHSISWALLTLGVCHTYLISRPQATWSFFFGIWAVFSRAWARCFATSLGYERKLIKISSMHETKMAYRTTMYNNIYIVANNCGSQYWTYYVNILGIIRWVHISASQPIIIINIKCPWYRLHNFSCIENIMHMKDLQGAQAQSSKQHQYPT